MDWSRIREAFRVTRFRPDPRSEIAEELAFHFAEVVRELEEAGMEPGEARREARRRFGDEAAYREELESIGPPGMTGWTRRIREMGWAGVETLRFAVRALTRSPGVCAAVVATLALGLGANVAMFRVLDRLLLSPPEQIRDADRVRLVYARIPSSERPLRMSGSFPEYRALAAVGGFESLAAYRSMGLVVGEGADADLMNIGIGSGDFFSLLGVDAAVGRLFGPGDDRLGAEPAAVLSWETWDGAFGRDPEVIGHALRVGEGHYTVVGVAPPGFTGVDLHATDVWLPLEPYASAERGDGWREARDFNWLRLGARLAPGVSDEAAAEEATAALRAYHEAPDTDAFIETAPLVAAERPDAGAEIGVARWLGAVSLIVLLIACANVGNLLLGRNLRRRGELAVRAALGIGHRRLVAQLTAEAALLALLGAGVGIALAAWAGAAVYGVLLPDVAFRDSVFDARLLAFTAVAVLFATLLAGVIPALQSSRLDLVSSLKAGGNRSVTTRTRTQVGLLVCQVTLSVVLLTGAAAFVRSMSNLRAIELGFEEEDLALVVLAVDGAQGGLLPFNTSDQAPAWPPNDVARVYEDVEARLGRLPGVSAALVNPTPFGLELMMGFHVPGLDSLPRLASGGPYPLSVSPEYFDVLGMELVAGRGIEPEDDRFGAEPVVVLNETMARALWPGEDPLGRCVMPGGEDHPCATVVGVVADVHRQAVIEDDPGMTYFVPIRQQILEGAPTGIFTRAPGTDRATLRAAAQAASPEVRFAMVTPFREVTAPELRPWILGASVFSAFGMLALLVAGVGLYSLFTFDVAGRSRELGIRSALGATRRRLFGLVVRDVALLGGLGAALGFAAVAGVRRWIDPLLYETSALELGSLMLVALTLFAVAFAAASGPGGRASRADPAEVLRAE